MHRVLGVAMLLLFVSCSRETAGDKATSASQGAIIKGVVREFGTDVPIAGVSVFVVRTSDRPQIRTNTDGDGHFALEGLNAGRHLVALVRDGYVVPGRLEISGYPFRVTENQHIDNVVFHLVPAGTISGRIMGPDGKPANRVEVQLLQNLYVMGQQQWSIVNRGGSSRNARVETNAHGEFRAIGVDPGQYVVRVIPHELSVDAVVPGGKSPGPLLYPGVREIARASMIEVKPAKETLLDDMKLIAESRGWIRVSVVNGSKEPLEGFGNWQAEPPGWVGSEYPLYDQRVVNSYHEIQPDSPGTYDIFATWASPTGTLGAKLRVSYQGADVMAKMAIEKPKGKLVGRVVMQEKEGTPPRPLTGVEVAIGPDFPYFVRSGPDGDLLLPEVYAGRYKLGAIRGLPADSYVLRVSQGSRDIFREDLVIENKENALDVVISEGAGIIEGKVVDSKGSAVQNALVALVPDSPLKERTDYYGAYHDARTDQNGAFDIHGITPGSYHAYSWADAPAGGFRNDAFMKTYSDKGIAVKLEGGGRANVDLRILDTVP